MTSPNFWGYHIMLKNGIYLKLFNQTERLQKNDPSIASITNFYTCKVYFWWLPNYYSRIQQTLLSQKYSIKKYYKAFSGLHYKRTMILNEDSRVVNKLETSFNDEARVIIYDRHMFIVQSTGGNNETWLWVFSLVVFI